MTAIATHLGCPARVVPMKSTKTGSARSRVAKFAVAATLVAAFSCGEPDSLLVVTVTADTGVPEVRQIRITLTNAGATDVRTFPASEAAPMSAVQFPATLALVLARSRSGKLELAFEALDASQAAVGHAYAIATIKVGGRVDGFIVLRPGPSRCGDMKPDPGESCDDGNRTSGDGCSSICQRENVVDAAVDVRDGPAQPRDASGGAQGGAGMDGGGAGAVDAAGGGVGGGGGSGGGGRTQPPDMASLAVDAPRPLDAGLPPADVDTGDASAGQVDSPEFIDSSPSGAQRDSQGGDGGDGGPAGPASKPVRIYAGGMHTCALMEGGSVACWGGNESGQFGDGTMTNRHAPMLVSSLSGISSLSTSTAAAHACALKNDGSGLCWGANNNGTLGDGTTTNRLIPVSISGLTGINAISAGAIHTCALKSDGSLYCWGANGYGQVGDGATSRRLTPVPVSGLSGASAISAGEEHTCAAKSDGSVFCWGYNHLGQLGDGTTTTRLTPVPVPGLSGVAAISAGTAHTCALKSDGSVLCWGYNELGQLGDGTTTSRLTPVPVPGLSGVAAISVGRVHTCAVKSDGSVSCWGYNELGQLGDGTTTGRLTPVPVPGLSGVAAISVGNAHTCSLKTDGTVLCWGQNLYGQLGDNSTTDRLTPTQVTGL